MKFRLYGSLAAACFLALMSAVANAQSEVYEGAYFCIKPKNTAPATPRDAIRTILPADVTVDTSTDPDTYSFRRVGNCPSGTAPAFMAYRESDGRRLGENINLATPNAAAANIKKVVIAIHGAGGGSGVVLKAVHDQVEGPPNLTGSVWVIAPHFVEGNVNPQYPDLLKWAYGTSSGDEATFGRGDASMPYDPPGAITALRISSYDVLDAIITHLIDNTKNAAGAKTIEEVVVMGFSRGAKTVNRYSLVTDIDIKHPSVRFRFASASGGSGVYVTSDRYKSLPNIERSPTLRAAGDPLPAACATDPTYDAFPFGLNVSGLPTGHYAKVALELPANRDLAVSRFKQRHRLFLISNLDNYKNPDNCGEAMQASSRTGSQFNYMYHLREAGAARNVGFCIIKDTRDLSALDYNQYRAAVHDARTLLGSRTAEMFWKDGMINCSRDDNINTCERALGSKDMPVMAGFTCTE